jgi:hypothetical protein
MKNGETIKGMKQKGRVDYGAFKKERKIKVYETTTISKGKWWNVRKGKSGTQDMNNNCVKTVCVI